MSNYGVPFLSVCVGRWYFHLHLGNYPRWLQVGFDARWPFITVTREQGINP